MGVPVPRIDSLLGHKHGLWIRHDLVVWAGLGRLCLEARPVGLLAVHALRKDGLFGGLPGLVSREGVTWVQDRLELLKEPEDLLKRLKLLLDALRLPICRDLEVKREWERVESVLLLLVVEGLQILEELVFGGDLCVVLKVVHHLAEVVGKAVKVDGAGDGRPPEVKMGLLIVLHLSPQVGACLRHHALH